MIFQVMLEAKGLATITSCTPGKPCQALVRLGRTQVGVHQTPHLQIVGSSQDS